MRKISHWLEEYNPGESVDLLRDLALSHAREGGALGKKIGTYIHGCRFRELLELEFDYQQLDDLGYTPEQIYHCRQAVAFFSKLEHLDIGLDTEEEALKVFFEAEEACKNTNVIFRSVAAGRSQFPPRFEAQLFRAQRKIAQVLGPVPKLSKLGFRFGKGATTLTKKREASVREKLRAGASCSEEFLSSARALLREFPSLSAAWSEVSVRTDTWPELPELANPSKTEDGGWDWSFSGCPPTAAEIAFLTQLSLGRDGEPYTIELRSEVVIEIHDGVVSFAPKNARIKRVTVTEPVLPGLFQAGVNDYLVPRFARVGLELKDQTRNQQLALIGSRDGHLATIDLRSASDMIAIELVYHLLPLDWACFLARGRTGHVVLTRKGRRNRIVLEKFSSMGNGFTFPLESLIFWALTCAVCAEDETVSVYGDDIICPSTRYEAVTGLLELCGFSVNRKKSYHTGPFRESCGKDYYRGIDVRPYFQKTWVSPRTLFVLHNNYVRRGDLERAESVKALIHPSLQIFGPDGYGDGHLIGEHLRRRPAVYSLTGFEGYLFDTFTIKGRKDIRPLHPGDYVLPSYTVYQRTNVDLQGILQRSPRETAAHALKAKMLARAHGFLSAGLPLPDIKDQDGAPIKGIALPVVEESEAVYKRISIYTLQRG